MQPSQKQGHGVTFRAPTPTGSCGFGLGSLGEPNKQDDETLTFRQYLNSAKQIHRSSLCGLYMTIKLEDYEVKLEYKSNTVLMIRKKNLSRKTNYLF